MFGDMTENSYFCGYNMYMMKYLRSFFTLFLACLCSSALAQKEDWFQNKRPQCMIDFKVPSGNKGCRVGSQATAPLSSHGVQYVPVVLTAFKDKFFTISENPDEVREYYHKYCNGTMDGKLYTDHGSRGSIRDYFVEQSDSAFLPEFVVIGPIVLDSVASYYGRNGSSAGSDLHYYNYMKESISKAYSLYDNWELFDNDKNGSVDMVFMLYAGLGESNGGGEDCIWPKETTTSTKIDGHVFATNAATCELRPTKRDANGLATETAIDGIGVFIHELSHALGLPDFYDTNYVAYGMDLWSVMDYGEYANYGYNPGNYTAYERDFMGWRPLVTLDKPCVLTIPCFADGGTGYKIENEGHPDEYYIIENRQPKGWDDKLARMGHGLQVTHVDFNQAHWNSNTVNTNQYHQRMTIIAANNNYKGTNSVSSSSEWKETLAGNLYPGNTSNYSLTDDSTPAAQVFSGSDVWVGSLMHKPLRNITENEDGTVTVCYCTNGQLSTVAKPTMEESVDGLFDIMWTAVENATRYDYELYLGDKLVVRDTIAETHLLIAEQDFPGEVRIRVRAMADQPEDYVDGEWSEFLSFMTDQIVCVEAEDDLVELMTISGNSLGMYRLNQLPSLKRDIYVVRHKNGKTHKIVM